MRHRQRADMWDRRMSTRDHQLTGEPCRSSYPSSVQWRPSGPTGRQRPVAASLGTMVRAKIAGHGSPSPCSKNGGGQDDRRAYTAGLAAMRMKFAVVMAGLRLADRADDRCRSIRQDVFGKLIGDEHAIGKGRRLVRKADEDQRKGAADTHQPSNYACSRRFHLVPRRSPASSLRKIPANLNATVWAIVGRCGTFRRVTEPGVLSLTKPTQRGQASF